nr:HAD-IA family hydrolase [Hymenobacter profundi]
MPTNLLPTIPTVKAVIFDVDGTLYEQSRLRRKMLYALLGYYALRPWRAQELLILSKFRAEREKRSGAVGPDLENAQYTWCAEKGGYSIPKIKRTVEQWIFRSPNRYLAQCVYPGTQTFFETLRQRGVKIGIYSDYAAHDKLAAMGLQADIVVSSTDPFIDRMKPNPEGLLYIAQQLEVAPEECLFIGDRQELDGVCAERANMPYRIVDKQPFAQFDFYHTLKNQLFPSTN